jgi:SAM-dependent methyltransferase
VCLNTTRGIYPSHAILPRFLPREFGELVGLGRLGADLGYANLSGLDMDFTSGILEHTLAYRLWQAPFARQKFSPVFKYNDLASARRVLDVACGPGTNTGYFTQSDYTGIDLNERYIQHARHRHKRHFVAADARSYTGVPGEQFDFILVNSFLHHLNTPDINHLLSHLGTLLSQDGHIHILELVLPSEKGSIARLLARWDRGKFARPLGEWRAIFEELFDTVVFEPYCLRGAGATLWQMIYFKGKQRR